MRFSLSFAFLVVTFVCLTAGLFSWLGLLGLLLACGLFGFTIAAYGLAKKKAPRTLMGFAVVAAVALILLIDMLGERIWDGAFTLGFDVTIVDANKGAPVQDVELTVGGGHWDFGTYPVDSQGKARFSHTFPCGGHDSALGITRSSWNEIPLDRYYVKIAASDGTEQKYSLSSAVGQDEWPMGDSALPPIVLRLERN